MRKIFFMAMLCAIGMSAAAQDEIETTMGADVVSNYVWRGQDLGSVSLQPTLGVGWRGLSLAAWGNVGLSDPDDSKEIDLTLGYTLGGLNIGITDYWVSKDGLDPQGRYFKYDAHGTNHVFEANIGYDFGFASLQWFTNFSGNDYKDDGKRAYSSYVEASVPFKLATVDWTATAGAVPAATDYYGTTGFAVTNLSLKATKDIKVTDAFSIPVFAQFVGNPCSQKAYLVFGLTLQP
ncbi:MAG: hypothetical protein IJ892_05920 [Prevotella sp.]|nr:hypothetical protein [Prevotella sp.]